MTIDSDSVLYLYPYNVIRVHSISKGDKSITLLYQPLQDLQRPVEPKLKRFESGCWI